MDSLKGFADKTKAAIASKTSKKPSSPTDNDNSNLIHDEENPFEDEESIQLNNSSKPKTKQQSQVNANIPPPHKKTKSIQSNDDQENVNSAQQVKPKKKAPIAESSTTGMSSEAVIAREKELKAREDKLLAMERQLDKRQAEVEKLAGKMKNWPWKCYPLVYHSIEDEIPQPMQPIVKRFYLFWKFMCICLIVNWLSVIVIWAQAGSMSIIDILLATLYIIAGVPGSFVMWYHPFYKTMKAKSSVSWSFFIMGFSIHWLYVVCMGISIPWFAGAGIIVFIKVAVSAQVVSIIFNLVSMSLWGLNWVFTGYLTKKARDEYKAAGQNLSAMKSGFIGEAVKMQIRG